jgi:hypothetical protein
VVSVKDPYGRILGFVDRTATFLSSSSSVVLTRLSGLRSRPTTFFMVVAGIEPGPTDLYPGTLTTRPQRRSKLTLTYTKIAEVVVVPVQLRRDM